MKRVIVSFLLMILLGVAIIFSIYFYFNSLVYSEENAIILSDFTRAGLETDLYYKILDENTSKTYKYKAIINIDDFKKIESDIYKIIVNRLACKWYKIYVNGHLVGTGGDLDRGHSNLWYALNIFDLDSGILNKQSNELILEVHAKNELGFLSPILITGMRESYSIYNCFVFGYDNLNVIAILFYLLSFVLLMIAYYKRPQRRQLFYVGLASLTMSFYLFSFLALPSVSYVLYIIRYISRASVYLAVFFMSRGFYKEYQSKLSLYLSYPLLSIFIVLVFMIDQAAFLLINNLFLGFIILNILSWIYVTLKHFKESIYAKIIFHSSNFLMITIIGEILNVYTSIKFSIHLFLVGTFIFSITTIVFVIIEFLDIKREMYEHKQTAEVLYEKAITDGMTGTYNHEHITSLLEDNKSQYALIIMDIDNFKRINDRYGHQFGDSIIKYVASKIKENVRNSDIVGRYGGDEFVVILYNCPRSNAVKVAKTIKKAVEKPYKESGFKAVLITLSMGIYISKKGEKGTASLNRADQALYYVKNHGKRGMKIHK